MIGDVIFIDEFKVIQRCQFMCENDYSSSQPFFHSLSLMNLWNMTMMFPTWLFKKWKATHSIN